jgi:hypothetical protein
MNENESELISIIRNSDDPERVATFFLNLFLGYLQTRDQSQEIGVAVPQESA